MEDIKYCVYTHTNKLNGKKYIGQTCCKNPNERWASGKGYNNNEHFSRAIEKYGWDNFEHKIVYKNLTHKEANEIECELIEKYDTLNEQYGYNKKEGGYISYNKGKHLSEEQKEKLRQANIGKKHSEETKIKISNSNKGKKKKEFTEEHKRKIGMAVKGRICSELTKEKHRNAITGRKLIHKDGVLKLVAKTEIDDYLTNGWILGMVI